MGKFGIIRGVSYAGRHNRVRERLLLLLDMLKASESGWHSGGKYYRLIEIAGYGVPWLSYSYLKTRLPELARYGYLGMRSVTPEKGRPCYSYRLAEKGKARLGACPEHVLTEAAAAILSAVPSLEPGYRVKRERAWPAVTETRRNAETPKPQEHVSEPERSSFVPDQHVVYCMKVFSVGEWVFYCGYPGRQCTVYEQPPAGAVVLERRDDWNKTRNMNANT